MSWFSSEPVSAKVGQDLQQFVKMIDTARLQPDQSAMIPGRMVSSDKGNWQYEVQRAVFEPQTWFACGLDGKHGAEILKNAYAEDHFCMMRNQRVFGSQNEDTDPVRMDMWVGEGHGGALANLYYAGLPFSINLATKFIPGMQEKADYHNVTYDCVGIYILPKWDMDKQEFIPDTWMGTGKAPEDLENRYALSVTLCNAMSVRGSDMPNNKNGKGGNKGDKLYIPFYEVHGNKFSRDSNGTLRANHCVLSEYSDLNQDKDVKGNEVPEPDMKLALAFKSYLEKMNITSFTAPEDFGKGIQQFKEQSEMCTGDKCTSENTSLREPYL